MSKFTLADIEGVKGTIKFKKLIVDGRCPYDEFCSQIEQEGNLKKQLIGILNIMNQVAHLQRLPKDKFRNITQSREWVKEFEIKKGDLRVYVIKEDGHIVILGGKKGAQDEDIKKFRLIKDRYLSSKQ